MATGVGSLSQESRNDAVRRETIRVFQLAGFHWLGYPKMMRDERTGRYLKMMRDERTGRYLIIEPNIGRPTGRSTCAEAGGVELLYTMYCDAVGYPLPKARQQRYTGIKWIFWRRDIAAALRSWRNGELTLRQWLRSWRGRKTCAVFSWSDPLPFLADLVRTARRAAAVLRRHRVSKEPPGLEYSSAGKSPNSACADAAPRIAIPTFHRENQQRIV